MFILLLVGKGALFGKYSADDVYATSGWDGDGYLAFYGGYDVCSGGTVSGKSWCASGMKCVFSVGYEWKVLAEFYDVFESDGTGCSVI